MEVKIDEKSIKKWSQDGKASWHRFLMDFGGFLEASWEGKWSQDRSKKASKKRWENGRHQDGQKIEKRRSDDPRGEGSRALGRYPPKGGANPSPPGRKMSTGTLFHTFPFQSLPFLFLSLPFPSLPLSLCLSLPQSNAFYLSLTLTLGTSLLKVTLLFSLTLFAFSSI